MRTCCRVCNEISLSEISFPKPLYDAVVEISFDSFEDFNTFFTSENYLTKVRPDEPTFFDTENYIAMATNETVVKPGA
ncbi:EthD domain-containing protein [Arcticibacter sp. MXS-1]|uniref:EthD domain-containing protein n=1 Tax=Arcticibacter sp. MXS-1 TaxID=3341726 RepID=UPI0035A8D7AA